MKNNQGFTLIETMVALLILGILGLMASQGLGGAFRVKDSVEGQIKEQEAVVVMLKHLQNDCEAMVKMQMKNYRRPLFKAIPTLGCCDTILRCKQTVGNLSATSSKTTLLKDTSPRPLAINKRPRSFSPRCLQTQI